MIARPKVRLIIRPATRALTNDHWEFMDQSDMAKRHDSSETLRIAVVWSSDTRSGQDCLSGVYREADVTGGLTLRLFDTATLDFEEQVLHPLRAWKPDGMIIRLRDRTCIARLSRAFPKVPIVSTLSFVHEAVTCVAADSAELIALARDHFIRCGVAHIALFAFGDSEGIMKVVPDNFRKLVPEGLEWRRFRKRADALIPIPKENLVNMVRHALEHLPKPLGVLTMEMGRASVILQECRNAGFRVPEDVQIIALDEADECLTYTPNLTGLRLPHAQIGQTAVKALLGHIRRDSPRPPDLIRVKGGMCVARESTGALAIGASKVPFSLDIMRARATNGLTVKDTAKLFKVGRSTFFKEFKAATGETPGRHLQQVRLEEACRLLRETSETVTTIAERCGFGSLPAFLHFFRRTMKETPSDYRRRRTPRGAGGHAPPRDRGGKALKRGKRQAWETSGRLR